MQTFFTHQSCPLIKGTRSCILFFNSFEEEVRIFQKHVEWIEKISCRNVKEATFHLLFYFLLFVQCAWGGGGGEGDNSVTQNRKIIWMPLLTFFVWQDHLASESQELFVNLQTLMNYNAMQQSSVIFMKVNGNNIWNFGAYIFQLYMVKFYTVMWFSIPSVWKMRTFIVHWRQALYVICSVSWYFFLFAVCLTLIFLSCVNSALIWHKHRWKNGLSVAVLWLSLLFLVFLVIVWFWLCSNYKSIKYFLLLFY